MSETRRWSWQQGSKVIREWRRSGLSITVFARERGLGPHRLRYWRDRVEAAGEGTQALVRRAEPKLVPGVVVATGISRISVHLPRGVVVEAATTGDVEPTWLAELTAALESV
jgi:hypothetical protein